jgi:hypothetical protein
MRRNPRVSWLGEIARSGTANVSAVARRIEPTAAFRRDDHGDRSAVRCLILPLSLALLILPAGYRAAALIATRSAASPSSVPPSIPPLGAIRTLSATLEIASLLSAALPVRLIGPAWLIHTSVWRRRAGSTIRSSAGIAATSARLLDGCRPAFAILVRVACRFDRRWRAAVTVISFVAVRVRLTHWHRSPAAACATRARVPGQRDDEVRSSTNISMGLIISIPTSAVRHGGDRLHVARREPRMCGLGRSRQSLTSDDPART